MPALPAKTKADVLSASSFNNFVYSEVFNLAKNKEQAV
jgi:hypothetical protein